MLGQFAGLLWKCPFEYLCVPLNPTRSSILHRNSVVTEIKRKSLARRARDPSIFTKTAVCNNFSIPKLVYVLQVLLCGQSKIQAFHIIFATVIWSAFWEQIKRDNLIIPTAKNWRPKSGTSIRPPASSFPDCFFFSFGIYPISFSASTRSKKASTLRGLLGHFNIQTLGRLDSRYLHVFKGSLRLRVSF